MKPGDVAAYAKAARKAGLTSLSIETPDGLKLHIVLGTDLASMLESAATRRAKAEPEPKKRRGPQAAESDGDPDKLTVPDNDKAFAEWMEGR